MGIRASTYDSAEFHYFVPLKFTGVALTCMGFEWPPPSIRWTKDSGALPIGVTSVVTTKQGRVKAHLLFDTPFSASFFGKYNCEIFHAGSQEGSEVSQQVQLFQQKSQRGGKVKECQEITSNPIFVHFRILKTGCLFHSAKRKELLVVEFQNLLYRTVLSLCNCDLEPNQISVIFVWCKEGAVMFRGSVQTNSSSLTRTIFCALYKWQISGALVSVNESLFILDNRCSLKHTANDEKDCMNVDNGSSGFLRTITITLSLISSFFILSICSFVVLIYYSRFYRMRPVL